MQAPFTLFDLDIEEEEEEYTCNIMIGSHGSIRGRRGNMREWTPQRRRIATKKHSSRSIILIDFTLFSRCERVHQCNNKPHYSRWTE
jgi:hypothetical protein